MSVEQRRGGGLHDLGSFPARVVGLLDLEPDLADGLGAGELDAARGELVVGLVEPHAGACAQVARAIPAGGMILSRGFVVRQSPPGGRSSAQLHGPGDMLAPPATVAGVRLAPTWRFLTDARVALLGEGFLTKLTSWPAVSTAFVRRWIEQAERLSLQMDICKQPHVETRVMLMLWYIAQRWGRVSQRGIQLPLQLTHAMLGQLVGARRPTVSLAAKQLEAQGALRRAADGGLMLDRRFLSETLAVRHPRPAIVGRVRPVARHAAAPVSPEAERVRLPVGARRRSSRDA